MSAPKVTLYSKPSCVGCQATKRQFAKLGIEYTEIDISVDAQAREYVMGLGYLSAPVVVAELPDGIRHWSEYRHELIGDLARELDAIAYLEAEGEPV